MFEKSPCSPHTTAEGAVNLAEGNLILTGADYLELTHCIQVLQHHHDDL
jgi:hypothetical protein